MMRRTFWVMSFFAVCAVGYASLVSAGLMGRFCPDVTVEKYTVIAAVEGYTPYLPMDELAAHYGEVPGCNPAPAPRTPATFLLNAPLLLVPDDALLWVMVPLVAGFIVAVMWAASKAAGVDERWTLLPLAALILSPHYSGMMVHYASPTMVVPVLVVATWVTLQQPRIAGFLLGIAAALKLWPGIVVVALLARSDTRRIALWAIASGAAVTAAGLLLPGVTVTGTVEALVTAGGYFSDWDGNWSLAAHYGWLGVVAGAIVFVWAIRGDTHRRFGGAVVAGLLLSPLVWAYYWLSALPVAFLVSRSIPLRSKEVATTG